MLKHCDRELINLLESGAPPPDLAKLGVFATVLKKFEKQAMVSLKLAVTFRMLRRQVDDEKRERDEKTFDGAS